MMSHCRFDLTWGPIEYHRRSLDNLQTAMKKSRKLCAIVLDTLGREVGVSAGAGFRSGPRPGIGIEVGVPVACKAAGQQI
jgi:pyruvate kinase